MGQILRQSGKHGIVIRRGTGRVSVNVADTLCNANTDWLDNSLLQCLSNL